MELKTVLFSMPQSQFDMNQVNPYRVLLVEDEPFVRQEIASLIESHSSLSLSGIAADFEEGAKKLFGDYDLLLIDKGLPGSKSGIDLIRMLNDKPHSKKILMMSIFDDRSSVMDAIDAGADGYFVKQDAGIVDAMCAVMSNGNPISPSVTKYFLNRLSKSLKNDVQLNNREIETLQALADGLKYNEMAERFRVSKHTVPDYIKSLYRKLQVNDRSSAVYVGIQKGLIR